MEFFLKRIECSAKVWNEQNCSVVDIYNVRESFKRRIAESNIENSGNLLEI